MTLTPKLLEQATHFEALGYTTFIFFKNPSYRILIKSGNSTTATLDFERRSEYINVKHFLEEYFKGLWIAKN